MGFNFQWSSPPRLYSMAVLGRALGSDPPFKCFVSHRKRSFFSLRRGALATLFAKCLDSTFGYRCGSQLQQDKTQEADYTHIPRRFHFCKGITLPFFNHQGSQWGHQMRQLVLFRYAPGKSLEDPQLVMYSEMDWCTMCLVHHLGKQPFYFLHLKILSCAHLKLTS